MDASTMGSIAQVSGVWAGWMAAMSWQVAALAVVVLALTLVFRRMPAGLRYLLWLLVFVKLVLPPYLATPWSVGNMVERALPVAVTESAGPETQRPERAQAFHQEASALVASSSAGLATLEGATATHRDSMLGAVSLSGGAMLVWAGVGGLLLAFLAVQYLRYARRLLASACAPPDQVVELLPGLLQQARIKRRVAIMTSSAIQTPAVFGLWRPVVLLPRGWEGRFSGEELAAVLLHELAHIRRGDLLAGWATALLTCAYWFHPMVWFANLSLRREREMACDDSVLEATKLEGKRYATTILRVAESFDGGVPTGAGFLGLLELGDNLLHRIRSAGDSRRVRRLGWSSLMVVALVAALAVPMGIWGARAEARAAAAVDLANAQAVWAKVVEVNRIWLDPEPENLSYTLNMCAEDGPPSLVHRVWVAGGHGRVEVTGKGQEVRAKAVFDERAIVSVDPASPGTNDAKAEELLANARQGTVWRMGIHALYQQGLPDNARLVESGEEGIVVLEAHIEEAPAAAGLGLIQTFYGLAKGPRQHVRIRIRTSDFVPVSEEDSIDADGEEGVMRFEIGPNFLDVGTQKAPETLVYRGSIPDVKEWTIQANFQVVDGVWILREGLNKHDGKLMTRIWTSDVSTKPVDPELVRMPGSNEGEAASGDNTAADADVEKAVEQAVTMLSTTSEAQADRVAEALGLVKGLPEQETLKWLCEWLDNDSPTLRRSAVYILQQLEWKDPSPAYPGLRKLLSHSEDVTRGMVALALASLGDAKSSDQFATMLKEDKPYVRRCVAWAFGELGDTRAIEPLEQALKDENGAVRANAQNALDRLKFLDAHKDAQGDAKNVVRGIWLIAGSTPTQYDRLDRAMALIEKANPETRDSILQEAGKSESQAIVNSALFASMKLGEGAGAPEAKPGDVGAPAKPERAESEAASITEGRILVETEKGCNDLRRAIEANPQLVLVGSKPVAPDELAQKVFLERGEACLVTFAPVAPFAPKDDKELLDAFNAKHPGGVSSHHYRTSQAGDGPWKGFILVDGGEAKEVVEKAFDGDAKIRVLKVEPATPDLLKQVEPYAKELGADVFEVAFAPKPPFVPKNREELLDAFNANLPKEIRTHHLRVTSEE